jgi:hypothetical protein
MMPGHVHAIAGATITRTMAVHLSAYTILGREKKQPEADSAIIGILRGISIDPKLRHRTICSKSHAKPEDKQYQWVPNPTVDTLCRLRTVFAGIPELTLQTSDLALEALSSIAAWCDVAGSLSLLPPLLLDASEEAWPVAQARRCRGEPYRALEFHGRADRGRRARP